MEDIIQVKNRYYIQVNASLAEDAIRVLKYGDMFAVFNRNGHIRPFMFENHGLYFKGTRFLSRLLVTIENRHPLLLSSAIKENNELFAVDMTNPDMVVTDGQTINKGAIHLFRALFLHNQSAYERLRVVNYGLTAVSFRIGYEFDADYVDIFEVRGTQRDARGELFPVVGDDHSVRFSYRGRDGKERSTCISFTPAPAHISQGHAEFAMFLEPGSSQELFVSVACQTHDCRSTAVSYERAMAQMHCDFEDFRRDRSVIETSNDQFNEWLERSSADLYMLLTRKPGVLYPYAGIPWFSTVFGRDGLITGLQTLWLYPHIARGVLLYLASTQATKPDPGRDAEPGKILHEEREGEMAALNEIPFGRYYGSIDATLLFIVLAGYYYERSGDVAFIRHLWPSLELALSWMETFGDRDGDGFIEYQRKAAGGLSQQGWKDSDDSVFHRNGDLAEPPIALCEVQGYAYEARIQIARLATALGKHMLADRQRAMAQTLRTNFNERFWVDDIGTYAIALDGQKRPCAVKSSNAGHCLFSGIAYHRLAERVVHQMLSDSFFSGWGVRTIARGEPRYNPMSYHNGSIWPHDNSLIALGMGRYGFREAAARVLSGMFDSSRFMDMHRLPELFCGFERRHGEGPVLYPVACDPQAWASASVFLLLQACLGITVDAVEQCLTFNRPILPSFLRELVIRDLQIGNAKVDIRLLRHTEDVGIHVLKRRGEVDISIRK